jgi:hypothetical protein
MASSNTFGQSPSRWLNHIRQIKLLESTRSDAKRILSEYETTDNDAHYQEFSNDAVRIEMTYATGTCSDDSDDEDASEVWNAREWTVTRIEISPEEPIRLKDLGLDLTKFKTERRWPDSPESLVFHDKVLGLALKSTENGIETLIFFPSRDKSARLCRNSMAAKAFYIRKGWFSQARPYDFACQLMNQHANVEEVNLSAVEIGAMSTAPISVSVIARDPENDVLSYNYKVSAGKIIGQGSDVEWDLTGVVPGTYSITVGVDDGAGIIGHTITKTVVVK